MSKDKIVSTPVPLKDTLMACFCRILFGNENREWRLWVRRQLLSMVADDVQFVIQHQRENCVYDKHRLCQLFSQRFHINVELPDEGVQFNVGSPYTLYLRHQDSVKFVQLVSLNGIVRNMQQLYDLRKINKDGTKCRVVGTFYSAGPNRHSLTVNNVNQERIYVIHPKAGTDYRVLVPEGKHLYVFVEEDCVACVGPGDPVNPHFYIGQNHVILSIIVAESITRAKQYLTTELHGIF